MFSTRKIIVAATALAGLFSVSPLAATAGDFNIDSRRGSNFEIMSPGNGLSLGIGTREVIAVLKTEHKSCHLTLVLAQESETGDDTRIVVPVLPGSSLQVDSPRGKSAEFFCNQGGESMNARVLRQPS